MQFQSLPSALALLALTIAQVQAYELTFYIGEQCRGGPGGHWVGGPDQGCNKEGAGVAKSAIVSSTGAIDDNFMIAFYSSYDCNPDTEIKYGDETDGCYNVPNYSSYQVFDMSKTE